MATSRAERPTTPAPVKAPVSTPWASLGRRQVVELTVPGVVIGLLAGAIAGGVSAAGGLALNVALFAGVTLGVPLALAGAGYEILLAQGRVPLGMLTPVALYWAVGFPVVRVLHAGLLALYAGPGVAVPYGWLDFVVYQVLLSVAFGVGYWWLHENFAPRWWFHLRDRNPVANFFVRHQLQYAAAAEQERQPRSGRKSRRPR
ncbi:MAG TPA: hypothetical protein VFD31_11945 [Thermoleophilaceae bacterium]|nr:hypothetical protein [Thermoleophilaceae bacterium]